MVTLGSVQKQAGRWLLVGLVSAAAFTLPCAATFAQEEGAQPRRVQRRGRVQARDELPRARELPAERREEPAQTESVAKRKAENRRRWEETKRTISILHAEIALKNAELQLIDAEFQLLELGALPEHGDRVMEPDARRGSAGREPQTAQASDVPKDEDSRRPTTANNLHDNRQHAILEALDQPVVMPFPDATPFEEVIKYIRLQTTGRDLPEGIPIYIDPEGLLRAGATMESKVKLKTEDLALKRSLGLLLKSLGLAFRVGDGLLTITSEEARPTKKDPASEEG